MRWAPGAEYVVVGCTVVALNQQQLCSSVWHHATTELCRQIVKCSIKSPQLGSANCAAVDYVLAKA